MDYETLKWIRAVHIYAFLTWVGALVGCSFILKAHAGADRAAHDAFVKLEKGIAMSMDIGATVAIIAGLIMLFGIEPSPLSDGGWMHAKLAAVVGLLALHGLARVKVGKLKRGEAAALPGWYIPVLEILIVAIIVFAAAKPF